MKINFTHETLIQFIYKECTSEEATLIKQEIIDNADFADEYYSLQASVDNLDSIHEEPSQTSIDIILNYAMEGVEHG